MRLQIRELMDQFEDPVVVLHQKGRRWVANRTAAEIMEKHPPLTEGEPHWDSYAALVGIRLLRLSEEDSPSDIEQPPPTPPDQGDAAKPKAPRARILNSLHLRNEVAERLERWASGEKSSHFAVAFFDLSRIRHVIEAFGHARGYQVLLEATRRIQDQLSPGDALAQFTRDECAVFFEETPTGADAEAFATRILNALGEPYLLDGMQVLVSSRAGVSLPQSLHSSVDSMLRDADAGLQRARTQHLPLVVVQEQTRPSSPHRLQLEYDLERALAEDQFFFEFQPVFHQPTGEIVMIESLLRWQHPRLGVISPSSFLELAEDSGLVLKMDLLGLERLAVYLRRWMGAYPAVTRVPISINISGRHFPSYTHEDEFHRLLASSPLKDCRIAFEITETALVEGAPQTVRSWERLREAGVEIWLDDFGEGFSSFGYLNQFRVDGIKIPGSFVRNCAEDHRSRVVLEAMANMTRGLGLKLIAEGVETLEQCKALSAMGIDHMQGFLFSHPVAAEEIPGLLRSGPQPNFSQTA